MILPQRQHLRLFYFLILGLLPSLVVAQVESDTLTKRKNSFIPLPVIYFTPETSWSFGAAAVYAFRFEKEPIASRPSQLRTGFAYTLNKQILASLNFQLFRKDELYKFYGELGYYDYIYEFSGIGNNKIGTRRELYQVKYPRVRINALYEVRPQLYLGLRYWMDSFNIIKRDEEGVLIQNTVTGSDGGFLSGMGIVANLDTRDNIFFATEGKFVEIVLFHNGETFGSPFNFSKLYMDYSQFWKIGTQQSIGLNLSGEFTSGNPTFDALAQMGGVKKMRGYFRGRYRDKQYLASQMEYRIHLFWRIGLTVFGSAGIIGPNLESLRSDFMRYSYGSGLRFMLSKKEKINIRIDAGFTPSGNGIYITIGEAF
ncbi:MAG: BamA/TamA family outer membrane protein [Saprospiraceae bacterium]